MRIIIFSIVLIYSGLSNSQNVSLKTNIELENDQIKLEYTITNKSQKMISFYKPNELDFCNGILYLVFKDKAGNEMEFNNCDELLHLDAIRLNCTNLRVLGSEESFTFMLKVDKPTFIDNSYSVKSQISYNDIYFLTDDIKDCSNNIYNQTVLSEFESINSN
jgi:hypothetical protein